MGDAKKEKSRKIENPFEELEKLRKKIKVKEKDFKRMIKESKKDWERF